MKIEGSRVRAAPIVNEGLRSTWNARVWVLWDGRARAGAGVGWLRWLAEILSFGRGRLWLLDCFVFLPF